MLKLKPGAVYHGVLKDQKQSHLGGVLLKIQPVLTRYNCKPKKESWPGVLSAAH